METKFTPGKWIAKKDNTLSSHTTEIFTNSVDVVNIVEPIMRIKHNEAHLVESIANAKLIAAAPDMYDTILLLLDGSENKIPNWKKKIAIDVLKKVTE